MKKPSPPRMPRSEVSYFFKRLGFFLTTGIPLTTGLKIMAHQSRGSRKAVFEHLTASIETGKSFSGALASLPTIFSPSIIHTIRAGEESGTLNNHTKNIGEELEKRKAMTSKIIGALIYPSIIALGSVSLTLFLILIIFPKIRSLFESFHTKLPPSTRFIMFVSDTVGRHYILIFLMLAVCMTSVFVLITKHRRTQNTLRQLALSSPIVGNIIQNYNTALFFRGVGSMLASSMPLERALTLASESLPHTSYRERAARIGTEIVAGTTFSSCLLKAPELFSKTCTELVEVGETSGTLAEVCVYISDIAEEDNNRIIKVATTLIEPALMIGMGLVVGFVALSIITPLYDITQNLKH